jgi:hypothetical protein
MMPTTETMPVNTTANDSNHSPDGLCGVCAHPLSAHDMISTRFCSATAAGALTRGCVCPVGD